jgi:apolipoprotein N-acyltransferase
VDPDVIVLAPEPPGFLSCLAAFRYTVGLVVLSIPAGIVSAPLGGVVGLAAIVAAIVVSPAEVLDDSRFHPGLLFLCSLLSLTVVLTPLLAWVLTVSARNLRDRDVARRMVVAREIASSRPG